MKCKILNLPKICDQRGSLTYIQEFDQVPFEIKRVFWTYDVPSGEIRGGHAFFEQHELIIALSGSFDVVVKDIYENINTYSLNRSNYGLLIPAKTWRHMENFSTNSFALHLSSSEFNELDYIREYEHLKQLN
jgi:dTDP-4-dehydrorhamnose 3,5-epimerase-like enzyme